MIASSGGFSETRAAASTLGLGPEITVLQQSWLLIAGAHAMEPQHSIVCVSAVTGDMQSANSKGSTAPAASTSHGVFPDIVFQL